MSNQILCIEDNPNNMLLLKRILCSFGYGVLEAQNGMDGLQIIEKEEVGLILLDINLPDIDGYEVIRRLRANQRAELAKTPVIVISANALKGDDQKALSLGCDMYLTKPIDFQELKDAVENYLPMPDES